MPSVSAGILPLVIRLFLADGAGAFLARAPSEAPSGGGSGLRIASVDTVATTEGGAVGTGGDPTGKHAVIGATQLHPKSRSLDEFPALRDAFVTGTHPRMPDDEAGRGVFIMEDWRRAWYTYGQCDRSLTREEYERVRGEGGFVVDPFTGEAEYDIDDVDGDLPDDLVGVLYRIGPGKFGVNGERVAHVLDADGMVLRFEFRPPEDADTTSRVKFTSRFVETEGFVEEREAKRFTKRGTFGTAPRGLSALFGEPKRMGLNVDPEENVPLLAKVAGNALNVDIKNAANTQVIAFGGKLLALWEAGMPYRLDPITLETMGQDFLGYEDTTGKLAVNYMPDIPKEFQPAILGGKAHTAHPKLCPRTGHLVGWTWAQNPSDNSMEITFTEHDEDGFQLVAKETHTIENCALVPHDMVLTEHYIVLKFNSLEMDQFSFLSGAKGPAECLGMDGRAPVRAHVFPRPSLSAEEKKEYAPFVVKDIPACFSIHFSHGYEDAETGNIVSYFSGWPPNDSESFLGAWGGFCPDYLQIPETFFWRLEIDPKTKSFVDLRVSPGNENMCIEHPVVHPATVTKSAKFAYAQCCNAVGDASAPLGYAKMSLDGTKPNYLCLGEKNNNVDVFWVGPRRFAGEPLVVPKAGGNLENEEEAYLVGLVFDAVRDQSSLMVFDLERDLKEGPVCTLWLKTALPHGLHGCFSPDPSVRTSCFC